MQFAAPPPFESEAVSCRAPARFVCYELNAMCPQDDDFWDSISPGFNASPPTGLEFTHAPNDGVLVVGVLLSLPRSDI